MIEGRYTGAVSGEPCFREGKVKRLNDLLQRQGMDLEGSWFYSDSHNDLSLLEIVTTPIAVDPDDELKARALEKNWEIRSFR